MRVLLFTHKSDIDGMGNAILSKIAFNNVDYVLCKNNYDLEEKITDYYNNKILEKHDIIYITDLSISKNIADIIFNNSKIKEKIYLFDHHQTALDKGINIYNNVTVIVKNKNKSTCATEIFYNYLINTNKLKKNKILDEFVELTREEDTYEWKKLNNIKAHDLAILYQSLGPELFINNILNKLNNNKTFNFTKEEENIIKNKKIEIKDKINNYIESIETLNIEKYKVGVCFINYEYRNEVADYLIETNANIDVIAMIALENSQISIRAIKDKKAPRIIAEKYGGGGHDSAAAIPLTKIIRKQIINTIFNQ